SAKTNSNVERLLELNPHGLARQLKVSISVREPHGILHLLLYNPKPLWCRYLCRNVVGGRAFLVAVLQGRRSVPVEHHIDVGGIRIQTLPHHEHRLSMPAYTRADERDIRGQCRIA